MDTASYKSLLNKTQEVFSCDAADLVTSFDILLRDCRICVYESLDVVTSLLSEAEVCISKLIEYMNDAVSLLRLLSNSINVIIGTGQTTCTVMKTFPTSVAFIIANVFSHCKDSEPVYGNNLTHVQKEAKDLFKSCHELQLAYLTVLEKHFVFNLSNKEEKTILLEALDINLRIVDTVQALDVKTMAVQWKTITAIYEKYSAMLANTGVFQACVLVLCQLIRSKIQVAVEANGGEKILYRSLKVANFLLKTLLKTCDIFDHANIKEYNNVISMLFYIHETSVEACLQTPDVRTQFTNLIVSPSECLLEKLLCAESFANVLLDCDIDRIKRDGNFLGFVLTITSVMDCAAQGRIDQSVRKSKLITCLYNILPKCNSWNIDGTVGSAHSQKNNGLFEHLLIHTVAMALTLNCEEYCLLEKYMIQAILSTDHISALFSSNVWTSLHLARDTDPQLLFNQMIWLCTMYKKLEEHNVFYKSPQKIHLTHTITRLFRLMENDDKIRICKQFRIHDEDNLSLWAALGIKDLPPEAKTAAEAVVAEKIKIEFQCFNSNIRPENIDKLIKVMRVAATCTFAKSSSIADYIMRAWSRTCPKHEFTMERVNTGTVWFHEYLQALIALTDTMWRHLCTRNVYLVEMLHYVTSMIQQCDADFKLLFIGILCKLATTDICEGKLDDFTAAFTHLYRTDEIVRHKLFITMKDYSHKNIDRILLNADNSLHESWIQIKDKPYFINVEDMKYDNFKYVYKPLESKDTIDIISNVPEQRLQSSENFEFADNVEKLFENDSDFEESAAKKVKLDNDEVASNKRLAEESAPRKVKDNSEVEGIVQRLETETALLRAMKENVFSTECRGRIQNVCDELINIIM